MKKLKKLNKMIIAVLMIIVFIIIILFSIINKDKIVSDDKDYSEEESYDEENLQLTNSSFSIVKNNSEYYAIEKIISDFCDYARITYDKDYLENNYEYKLEEEVSEEDKRYYRKMMLGMLSTKYINEFNVSEGTLENNLDKIAQEGYKINSMYFSNKDNNVIIYLIYGVLEDSKKEYSFVINVDLDSNAYEIYLNDYIKKYKYTEEKVGNLEINANKINLNEYNAYNSTDISNEDMAKKYFNMYKNELDKNLQEAYNSLEKEYREKRFSDYSDFKEFYSLKKEQIIQANLSKYKINNYDTYSQYICVDNYDNYYIFNVTGVMRYTVMLDDYTIEMDSFKEAYNNATPNQKVYTNIEKFFKMLNNKDYKAAYSVLDDTFKKNNFPTLDKFKKYAKQNFFENTVIKKDVNVSTSGNYYVCVINTLSGDSLSAKQSQENMIVSLEEGTDFKMSFTVKK